MNSRFPSYEHPDHVKAERVLGSEAKKGDTGPPPLGTRYVLGQLTQDRAFQLW